MDPVSPTLCPASLLRFPYRPRFRGWGSWRVALASPSPQWVSQAFQVPALTMGNLPSGAVTLGCSGLEIGGEHKMECFEVRELSTSYSPPSPQQGNLSGQGEHQKGTCHCSHMSTRLWPRVTPAPGLSLSVPAPRAAWEWISFLWFPSVGRRWGWDGIRVRWLWTRSYEVIGGHWSLSIALSSLASAQVFGLSGLSSHILIVTSLSPTHLVCVCV